MNPSVSSVNDSLTLQDFQDSPHVGVVALKEPPFDVASGQVAMPCQFDSDNGGFQPQLRSVRQPPLQVVQQPPLQVKRAQVLEPPPRLEPKRWQRMANEALA